MGDRAPGASAPPKVVFEQGVEPITLARVGDTSIYAASTNFPEGSGARWAYEVDGKRLELPATKGNSRSRRDLAAARGLP